MFRLSCVYGPRQFGNEDQGWVAHFIISSVFGRQLTIYGDGKQVRDVLYINDPLRAFEAAMERVDKTKGEVYNNGGGPQNTVSLLEFIQNLESLTKRKIDLSFDKWRLGDQKVYYSNVSKAQRDLGWKPLIKKDEGIKRLYNWVKGNRELFF